MINETILKVRRAILINYYMRSYYGKKYDRQTPRYKGSGTQKRLIAGKAGAKQGRLSKSQVGTVTR